MFLTFRLSTMLVSSPVENTCKFVHMVRVKVAPFKWSTSIGKNDLFNLLKDVLVRCCSLTGDKNATINDGCMMTQQLCKKARAQMNILVRDLRSNAPNSNS
jgi:hypothetical protein